MAFFTNKRFNRSATSGEPILGYAERLRRLRVFTTLFLLSMLLPLTALTFYGLHQIGYSQQVEYQRDASNLIQLVNKALTKRRLLTNAIPADAFNYYQPIYNPITQQTEQALSPLSALIYQQPKISIQLKGLVGFFQFTQQGEFNSPIWPYPIEENQNIENAPSQSDPELTKRRNNAYALYELLAQSESIQTLLKEQLATDATLFRAVFDVPGHFVFYRVVSHADQRLLQGYVVQSNVYFTNLITGLLQGKHFDVPILVGFDWADYEAKGPIIQPKYFLRHHQEHAQNEQVAVEQLLQPLAEFQTHVMSQATMAWPYDKVEVTISTNKLPVATAQLYIGIFASVVILAILLSCFGFYHLGIKQLQLAEQRLNFVSSVSHELKTPLTSIRMYSEMLKDGVVLSEDHKKEYYEFVFGESERLTRLINNILQFSKLNQPQQDVQPEYKPVTMLADIIRSQTSTTIAREAFEPNIVLVIANAENIEVLVDQDAFSQVVINIVDNSLKFFDQEQIQDPSRQKIEFVFRESPDSKTQLELEIRDYGSGISQQQEQQIFELFYRGGNELTRTTQGTGIGLALVKELISAQQGSIRAVRRNPGLSMILTFQIRRTDKK